MRRLIAVVCLSTLFGCAAAADGAASGRSDVVSVLKVTDGDTIHVLYEGRDERVRLIGIDTPEVPWYGGEEECFGVEAGLYARNRLSGRRVRLEFDVERRDRYDRLLAYVYVGKEMFNLTLVRQGYATAYPVRPDTRWIALFASAESAARAAGRGLWSVCGEGS
jgi:micrococcal nuclease